jgi:23S rRNA pseudouridine1911/1915/1917 synthase
VNRGGKGGKGGSGREETAPTERLARRVAREHPQVSFTRAKQAVEAGQVTVDGQIVQNAGALVAAASRVVLDAGRPRLRRPEKRTVELLHADEDVAVAVKPAGLLTNPTPEREQDTLVSRVSLALARRAGERPYVAVVQRLDKETSGLVVFATSRRGLAELQAQLASRSLGRVYEAVVEGEVEQEAGTFDQDLVGDGTHRRRWIAHPGEAGRPAVTHWRVVRRFAGATLVRVTLETGRTHQIRIHFAAAGHPVVGEKVYRRRARERAEIEFPRLALHAAELAFEHPADGRSMRFEAARPADFAGLVEKLRRRPHTQRPELTRPAPRVAADRPRRAARPARGGRKPKRRQPDARPPRTGGAPAAGGAGEAGAPPARLPRRQRKR